MLLQDIPVRFWLFFFLPLRKDPELALSSLTKSEALNWMAGGSQNDDMLSYAGAWR